VSRRLVTAVVVAAVLAVFAWEWAAAPRVHASAEVRAQLATARGQLYLGTRFEGLPLRSVHPFLYSDCVRIFAGCAWLKVDRGRVTGGNPAQVARARRKLTPVR